MKNKIVGILVATLLIATAVLPVVGTMNENMDITTSNIQQPTVEWEKTFGGDEFDMIYSVEPTNDGGYIACGVTEESGMSYVWLLKLDSDGNEEWSVVNHDLNASKMTSASMEVIATYVIQTDDGGYIVTGWGVTDVVIQEETIWAQVGYLWKVTATGTTEWLKHDYGDEEELWVYLPYHVIELEEGYMVSGWRIYYNMEGQVTNMDGMLMKTDENGNVEWEQTYDAGGEDKPCSLCPTNDGGYLLTGCTDSDDVAQGAFWMIKTDGDGNKQWDKIFDGPKFEYSFVRYCFQTSDGGYIMCGNTQSYGAGNVDLWIIKTDSSGNKEWDKTFGGTQNDYTWSFDATTDSGYVFGVAKNYGGFHGTRDDIWIVKTDDEGNAEWKFQIEKDGTQCTRDICQTADGGYIVAAATSSIGSASGDAYLVKVASFDNERPGKAEIDGPSKGKPDKEYTFTATASDPDGDSLSYMWDWGDGNFSEWLDDNEATYTWTSEANFDVRVMTMDEHGGESDWSDPFEFSTPRNKALDLFASLIETLLERFPLLKLLIS